jgi:hypothetical protein
MLPLSLDSTTKVQYAGGVPAPNIEGARMAGACAASRPARKS